MTKQAQYSSKKKVKRDPYHPPRGWAKYNQQQKQTASCFLLISPELIEAWFDQRQRVGKGGRQVYSEAAIEFILSLKLVFQISLRRAEGLAREVLRLQGLDLPVADYTTLCRRQRKLKTKFQGSARIAILDSTGMQLFSAGQWRQKRFGMRKHKGWRKLHIGINLDTGRVISASSTYMGRHDGQELPKLVRKIEAEAVMADGAYDHAVNWRYLEQRGIEGLIRPKRGAALTAERVRPSKEAATANRDYHVARIRKIGEHSWRWQTGFTERARVESAIARLKTYMGPGLSARRAKGQDAEALLRLKILNQILEVMAA